jgi:hypothetical protein
MVISHELQERLEISVNTDTENFINGQNFNIKSKVTSKDFDQKILNERISNEEVFFNNLQNQEIKSSKKNLAQINIKKESTLPVYNPLMVSDSKALGSLINFFSNEPYINIYNFRTAEVLLNRFINFKSLNDLEELRNKLQELQQELDKSISNQNKFGKALISWSLRTNGVKLSLIRANIQGFKQYIAIDFTKESKVTILNCWNGKLKKNELIKKRSQSTCHKRSQSQSICFDAEVWKSFNFGDISFKNYEKTLDCIERNRNTLPELIKEINKKNLFQVIHEPYLNKVAIKSDNRETTFFSFVTRSSQKVDIKLCSYASSITFE